MVGDGRIVLDDATVEEDTTNGCRIIPPKKARKPFPVDLPLDIVLGKMPQKVDGQAFLFLGHIGYNL